VEQTVEQVVVDIDALLRPVLLNTKGSPRAKLRACIRKSLETEGVNIWDARRCLKRASKGAVLRSRTDGEALQHESDAEPGGADSGATPLDSEPTLWSLVNDDHAWNDLVRQVRRRMNGSPSPEAMRARLVRTLFARVLMPFPCEEEIGLVKSAGARAAFAWIVLRMIDEAEGIIREEGALRVRATAITFLAQTPEELSEATTLNKKANALRVPDTAIVTATRLGAELGWTRKTAAKHLEFLCSIGYLQRTNEVGNGRYRVTPLGGPHQLWLNQHVGGHLSSAYRGRGTGLWNAIGAVSRPAFTHHATLGLVHWLRLLTQIARIDASTVGFKVNSTHERKVRARLRSSRLYPEVASFRDLFADVLEQLADEPGAKGTARERWSVAIEEYREAAAKRAAEAKRIAAIKKATYTSIDKILDRYPVPAQPQRGRENQSNDKRAALKAWRRKLETIFAQGAFSDEYRQYAQARLEGHMLNDGYGPNYAARTSRELTLAGGGN
jgi:hypothetical protein